jgi:hypothetical protein
MASARQVRNLLCGCVVTPMDRALFRCPEGEALWETFLARLESPQEGPTRDLPEWWAYRRHVGKEP